MANSSVRKRGNAGKPQAAIKQSSKELTAETEQVKGRFEALEDYVGKRLYPTNAVINSHFGEGSAVSEVLAFSRNVVYIALAIVLTGAVVVIVAWIQNFPHWLRLRSGLIRPVMTDDEERQVLILGIQGSGTTQMSNSLKNLGLEIEHENSNAYMNLCRDGSIGWVHGIYIMQQGSQQPDVELLCDTEQPRLQVFHPYLIKYFPCSNAEHWSPCWRKACRDVIRDSYGCKSNKDAPGCEPSFHTYLLQVRHPLRNIASNVVKYCDEQDWKTTYGLPRKGILEVIRALLPDVDWQKAKGCPHIFTR